MIRPGAARIIVIGYSVLWAAFSPLLAHGPNATALECLKTRIRLQMIDFQSHLVLCDTTKKSLVMRKSLSSANCLMA